MAEVHRYAVVPHGVTRMAGSGTDSRRFSGRASTTGYERGEVVALGRRDAGADSWRTDRRITR